MSTKKKIIEHNSVEKKIAKDVKDVNNDVKYPVSDDLLDFIDAQVDQFNDTNNLGEKISIHRQLQQNLTQLKNEVDLMVDLIDKIDMESMDKIIKEEQLNNTNSNIDDDIVNIEKMINEMKNEEIMQIKLQHYTRIMKTVQNCRAKCDSHKMIISKV